MFRSRALAGAATFVLLAGCSGGDSAIPPSGGYTVGDEPLAVRAGANVLASGGSATDAAAAMYFTLAVTYPVAAGLGGGGLCVVHDAASGRNEEFDFLPRDASGGGAYAVPGNVSGFALMQSVYGRLPWQRVVAPGESYAATGFPISAALAARLTPAENVVRLDASLAAEFMDESGHVKQAGAIVSSPDLGRTLTQVRTQGPDGFYKGRVAGEIIGYSSSQSGAVGGGDLAAYQASRGTPQVIQVGDQVAYLAPARTGAGAFAGSLLSTLSGSNGALAAGESSNSAVGSAVKRALDQYGVKSLPQDLGATGFAAVDASGQAVACAVTMNGPFGSGHTAQGTGVTLAGSPSAGQAGLAAAFLTPIVATDGNGGSVTLAGAGAGGPNGTASIAYALVKLASGESLSQPGDLRSTGMAPYDTVNVIACQSGTCAALPDPAAHGYGAAAGDVASGN
ncbi:MAG TPA: gamma-glutamyltransferase [Rhizomicrobium sp.]|nr:gamma-glutamyltransferase [Rhizomicrobium sp.]